MGAAVSWSASHYTLFERERTRPVRDLLGAVEHGRVGRAVDLGCGPGNSTEVLVARFAGADILGIDSSPDMIAAARARLPRCAFEVGDIAAWRPGGSFDVILSNAALHWVPDHASLLPRLAELLSPGGVLAIQLPDNLADRSQLLMQRVAEDGPWAARLAHAPDARTAIGDADHYYALLKPHCAHVDIWRTEYMHALQGAEAVVTWFSSTGLLPYLAPLDADERLTFLEKYRAAVKAAYQTHCDGSVLLTMPRLFIVATAPG